MMQAHTGQISAALCGGVDPEDWKRACSIPLHPNVWNEWVLIRSIDPGDEPSVETLKGRLGGALRFWLGEIGSTSLSRIGPFDNIEMEFLGEGVMFLPAVPPAATLANCRLVPGMGPETLLGVRSDASFVGMRLRFVYRGVRSGMPWPAVKGIGLASGVTAIWCPIEADWIATASYPPDAQEVPAETKPPGAFGGLGETIKETAGQFGRQLAIGIAVSLAVGYILMRR